MKKQNFSKKRLKLLTFFQKIDFNGEFYFFKNTGEIITVEQMSKKMKCSDRTIQRMYKSFKFCHKNGNLNDFLIHKNKGKKAWNEADKETTKQVVEKYKKLEKYYNEKDKTCLLFPSQFIYELELNEEKTLSNSTIRKALNNECILSPYAKKKTKKAYKKNPYAITDDFRKEQNQKALLCDAKKNINKLFMPFGRRIEGDACFIFIEFLGFKIAIGALIDHSGYMLCADCELEETNPLYFSLFSQLFAKFGIPETFVIDCRFTFYSPVGDHKTDFTRSLESLGINVICSSNPKAKPNIERAWSNTKKIIKFDFVKFNIQNFEQLKDYCKNELPKTYNERYAKTDLKNRPSVFRKIDPKDIPYVFEKTYSRTVTKYGSIKLNNVIYKPVDDNGKKINFWSDKVVVHERIYDNVKYVRSGTNIYYLKEDNLVEKNEIEIKDQTIKELNKKLFIKNKEINYLKDRIKNLESFINRSKT